MSSTAKDSPGSETLGLRERQKARRHRMILLAAGKLFAKHGFDQTTLEDIAEEAVVSVPTVYSYFSSKNDLLLALFEADESMIAGRVEAILADLPKNGLEAIVAVQLAIITAGYDVAQKRVWREISAAALCAPQSRRADFVAVQETRLDWLGRTIEELKKRRQIRADLDEYVAARVIYAVGRNCFRMYLMDDHMTVGQLETNLRSDLSVAFNGMKPVR